MDIRVEFERLLPALVAPFQPSQENNEIEVFGIERRSLTAYSTKESGTLSESKDKGVEQNQDSQADVDQLPPAAVVAVIAQASVCAICLEDIPSATSSLCGVPSCARLCGSCVQSYVGHAITSSFGVCAPVRCVDVKCKAVIPVKRWKALMPPAVIQKYVKGASDVLTLQCGGCHRRGTLFEPYPHDQTSEQKDLERMAKAAQNLSDFLNRRKTAEAVDELLALVPKFCRGEIPAGAVMKQLDAVMASDLKVSKDGQTYEQVTEQIAAEREELQAAKAKLLAFDNSPEQTRANMEQSDMRAKLKALAIDVKTAKILLHRAEHAVLRRQMKKKLAAPSVHEAVSDEVSSSSGVARRRLVFSDVEVFVPLSLYERSRSDSSTSQESNNELVAPSASAPVSASCSSSSCTTSSASTSSASTFTSASFTPSTSSASAYFCSGPVNFSPSFLPSVPHTVESKDDSQREQKVTTEETNSPPSSPGVELKEAALVREAESKLADFQQQYDQKRAEDAKARADLAVSLRIVARTAHIGVLVNLAAELYQAPMILADVFGKLLDLIDDVERRAALQLSFYLRNPKVNTKCCSKTHCFKCKTQGFHEGKSCEEVQPVSEVKSCPGCNISLFKGDGCSSVTCVCGHNFNWSAAPVAPVAAVVVAPPPSVQAAPDWECRACTFLNGLQRTECEVCLTPRPRA